MQVSRSECQSIVLRFLPRLGIDPREWRIKVVVNATPESCEDDNQDAEAFTRVSSAYQHATITVNAWQINSKLHLRWILAHECGHIFTDEIAAIVRDRLGDSLSERPVEQLTERIARLLVPGARALWGTEGA